MPRNKKYVYICSPKRKVFPCGMYWRDAGVVDRAALEMRCTGNCTGGSNPSLSAINTENQQIAKQTPNFTPKNVKLGVLYYINEVRYSYFRDCVLLIKFIQSHNN